MNDLSLLKRYDRAQNYNFQFENSPRSAGLKNSKRFLARAGVGEMLFPFYFRSGTDKIDEKRLT